MNQTKLLGLILSNDLTTKSNTTNLVKKGYQRMIILHKLYEFNIPLQDMVQIYCLFVRSILEFNAVVWFASISEEEKSDLERVQKVACKILLKQKYTTYENAQITLKIENLQTRRLKMALKFGKKCLVSPQFSKLFPLNQKTFTETRDREKYKVNFANKSRLKNSAIPKIQRLLNDDARGIKL